MKTQSALKLIKVAGKDAESFLQGQLSCDIKKVTTDKPQLGAHCNIKGRVESLFELFKIDDDFYLLMPTSIIQHALALLKKYAIFSKVELTIVTPYDITLPQTVPDEFEDWRLKQIESGIPTLFPETIALFLPHDINLVELDAVSFTKGCYLGQEIVARMQHLGKPKRHMVKMAMNAQPGDIIDEGVVVDSVAGVALVVTSR